MRVQRPGASPGRPRRQRNRNRGGRWPWSFVRGDQRGRSKRSSSAPRLRHPVTRFPKKVGGGTRLGGTSRTGRDVAKVCPTSDGVESVVVVPIGDDRSGSGSGGGGDGGDGSSGGGHGIRGVNGGLVIADDSHHDQKGAEGSKSDEDDSDSDDTDEHFSVDVDVVDDVTYDEGFELGEVRCG